MAIKLCTKSGLVSSNRLGDLYVMNNCEVINAFEASDIEAKSFDALSLASSLARATRNRANTLRIAFSLFSLNRNLIGFLNEAHAIMEGKKKAALVASSPESVTPERMKTVADNLEHVYRIIDYIYESSKRARLTNNSLTAGSLSSLRHHGEELLDIADWFELMADPKQFSGDFERAKQEKELGELYDLSQVK